MDASTNYSYNSNPVISIRTVSYDFCLNDDQSKQLEKTIRGYAQAPSLNKFFYRIANFFKAMVGRSDWQVAQKNLMSYTHVAKRQSLNLSVASTEAINVKKTQRLTDFVLRCLVTIQAHESVPPTKVNYLPEKVANTVNFGGLSLNKILADDLYEDWKDPQSFLKKIRA